MDSILGIALMVVRGFIDVSSIALEWLNTPIGIFDARIRPIEMLLPSGIAIWLVVVIIQIIRGK